MKKRIISLLLVIVMIVSMIPSAAISTSGADVKEYDVEILGITVTSENRLDILGDGKVSYSPDENTVTVKKSLSYNKLGGNAIWFKGDGDAAVKIIGDINIFSGNNGICKDGKGSLTVKGDSLSVSTSIGCGLWADESLVVDLKELSVSSSKSCLKAENGSIEIKRGNLELKSTETKDDGDYSAMRTKNGVSFGRYQTMTAATEPNGTFGKYDKNKNNSYDHVKIVEADEPELNSVTINGREVLGSGGTQIFYTKSLKFVTNYDGTASLPKDLQDAGVKVKRYASYEVNGEAINVAATTPVKNSDGTETVTINRSFTPGDVIYLRTWLEVTWADGYKETTSSDITRILIDNNITAVDVSASFTGTASAAESKTTGAKVTNTKWYKWTVKNGSGSYVLLDSSADLIEGNTYKCEVTIAADNDYKLASGYTVKINGEAANKTSGTNNTWWVTRSIKRVVSYIDVMEIALPEVGACPDFTGVPESSYTDFDKIEWFPCNANGVKTGDALSASDRFEKGYYRVEVTVKSPNTHNVVFEEVRTSSIGFYFGAYINYDSAIDYFYPYPDDHSRVTMYVVYHTDRTKGAYTISVDDVILKDGEYLSSADSSAVTTTRPSGGYAYYKDGVLTLNNWNAGSNYNNSNGVIEFSQRHLKINLIGENWVDTIKDKNDTYSSESYDDSYNLTIDGDGSLYLQGNKHYMAIAVDGIVTFEGGYTEVSAEVWGFIKTDLIELRGGDLGFMTAQSKLSYDTSVNMAIYSGTFRAAEHGGWGESDWLNVNFLDKSDYKVYFASSSSLPVSWREAKFYHCQPFTGDDYYDFAPYDYVMAVVVEDFKVYFCDENGRTISTETVTMGDVPERPADPVKDGYEFLGWYTSEGEYYNFTTPITETTVLKARFDKLQIPSESITIGTVELENGKYLANGATASVSKKPSGGYAHFKDGVLTLHNYEYTGSGTFFEETWETFLYTLIMSEGALRVVLEGENILTSDEYDDPDSFYQYVGIYGLSNVTLEGDGSIRIITNRTGIYSVDMMTINGGTYDIQCFYRGFVAGRGITVNDGFIDIIVDVPYGYGISIADGDLYFNGGCTSVKSCYSEYDSGNNAIICNYICFAEGMTALASTEPNGELGEFVMENIDQYDYVFVSAYSNVYTINGTISGVKSGDSVTVQLFERGLTEPSYEVVVTGSQSFIIDRVFEGKYSVKAFGEGYEDYNVSLYLVEGPSTLNIRMVEEFTGYTVSGDVLGVDPNTAVYLYFKGTGSSTVNYSKSIDAGDGFIFEDIPAGTYTLTAKVSGFDDFVETVTVTDKNVEIDVVFEKLPAAYIYVAGVKLDSGKYLKSGENAATSTKPSDKYAYYKDGVLTLHNYEYTGKNGYFTDDDECMLIYTEGALTVVVEGTNKLDCNGNEGVYGIRAEDSDLTIKGSGTLNIKSYYACLSVSNNLTITNANLTLESIYSIVIEAGGIVTVTDATVTGLSSSVGIWASDGVNIKDSTVNISAESSGISSYGAITIENSRLTVNSDHNAINSNAFDTAVSIKNSTADLTSTDGRSISAQYGSIVIDSGTVTANGLINAMYAGNKVIINGGKIDATAVNDCIYGSKGVEINGGSVTVKSTDTEKDSSYYAIRTDSTGTITISYKTIAKASTEPNGSLGKYVAADYKTYDLVVIVPNPNSHILGDINGDGEINAKDSNLMKQIIAGAYEASPGSVVFIKTDIDGDGSINGKDSNLLKQMIAGVM